jgi:hypothetical protein
MTETWKCSVCGALHEGLPLDWAFDAPAYWNEDKHAGDGFHNADLCVIPRTDEGDDHFVRGLIEIPILDSTADASDYFGIGAWVSLSERNFKWYVAHFEATEDEQGEPWFGWLSNSIPIYPDTLGLHTNVHLRGGDLRPLIEVEPTDNPLSLDQRHGITLERARELSARWFHG